MPCIHPSIHLRCPQDIQYQVLWEKWKRWKWSAPPNVTITCRIVSRWPLWHCCSAVNTHCSVRKQLWSKGHRNSCANSALVSIHSPPTYCKRRQRSRWRKSMNWKGLQRCTWRLAECAECCYLWPANGCLPLELQKSGVLHSRVLLCSSTPRQMQQSVHNDWINESVVRVSDWCWPFISETRTSGRVADEVLIHSFILCFTQTMYYWLKSLHFMKHLMQWHHWVPVAVQCSHMLWRHRK